MFRRLRRKPDHDAQQRALPAVETHGLRKVYRSGALTVEALRGIDLCIQRGELVVIVGPSGCGKTTLLNWLAGLEHSFEGEIQLAGQALRAMSDLLFCSFVQQLEETGDDQINSSWQERR